MRRRWFGLVIAAVAVVVSIWAYPQLPPTIATHWNVGGTADGFSSRATAVLIMPLVIIALTGLFNVLPKLDPRRANYAKFIDTYWLIANAVILFILIGHGMIVATGLGYPVKVPVHAHRRRLALHRARQLPHARRPQLVHRHSHAVDALERHRVAEDAPHRWVAHGRRRLRPRSVRLSAAGCVPAAAHRGDPHRGRDSSRAVLRVVETGTGKSLERRGWMVGAQHAAPLPSS